MKETWKKNKKIFVIVSTLPEMVRVIVCSTNISPRLSTSTNIVSMVNKHEDDDS